MSVTIEEKKYIIDDRTLQERAVVFAVNLGALGQQRKISTSNIEIDADKELIKASALLLECPETRAIRGLDSEIRRYLKANALPGPLKRGLYFLAASAVDAVDKRMIAFATERSELVDKLMAVYTQRVHEDSLRLRSVWDAGRYPPAERVRSEYHFAWQYLALANPNAMLSPEIAAREREKLEAMFAETVEECQIELRSQLSDLVNKLVEALTGERGDGKPKIFRDSKVGNVIAFLDTFNNRNIVAGDVHCAQLVTELKQLLTAQSGNWIDPDVLRDNETFRTTIKDGFVKVQAELDAMLEDKPNRRRFRFNED